MKNRPIKYPDKHKRALVVWGIVALLGLLFNLTCTESAMAGVGNDLNGDGRTDLLWRNTKTGGTAIWLLNGATIGSAGFPGGVSLAWQIAGIGDVNGDGKADVIWRHTTSATVAIWLMNGVTITSVGFPASVPTAWSLQGVGDLNGDGQADLVWRNTNDGNTALWLMNGARIAASGFLGKVSLTWQLAGVGDVSGDGKADLIWRNGTSHAVAIWVMNGLTMTSSGFPGNASPDVQIGGVGDVNGDGKADLLWRNTSNGDVEVWLLNGTTIASSSILDKLPSQWQIVQVGDADGDGKADVIWRDTNTGRVVVWLLNGLSVSSDGSPGTTSEDWIIANRPSLPVTPTPLPLIISSGTTLPPGTVGQAYNVTLSASGGTPPFSWSITSGSLPGGLNLNPSTGRISGTPTGAKTFTPTIRVQDSGSPPQTNQKALSVTINTATSWTGAGQFHFASRVNLVFQGGTGAVAGGGPIIAVEPSAPSNTPITVTAAAATAVMVYGGTWDTTATQFTNVQQVFLVYVSGGKLWRVATAKSSGVPGSGANPPVQISNESSASIICGLFVINRFSSNPATARIAYELAGADGQCGTGADNVTKMASVSDSAVTPPFVFPTGLTLTSNQVTFQSIFNLTTGAATHFFMVDVANNATLKIVDVNTKAITTIQANIGSVEFLAQDTSDRVLIKNKRNGAPILYIYTISSNSLVPLLNSTGSLGLAFWASDDTNLYVADEGTLYQVPFTATTPSNVSPILNIHETITGVLPSSNRIYVGYLDFGGEGEGGLLSIPKGGGPPRIEVPLVPGQVPLGLPFSRNGLIYFTIVTWTPGTIGSPITSATAVIRREDGTTLLSQPDAWLNFGIFERKVGFQGEWASLSTLLLLTSPGMSFAGGTLSLIDAASGTQGAIMGTIPTEWNFPVTNYGLPFQIDEFVGESALGFASSGDPTNFSNFSNLIFFIDTTKPNSLTQVPVSGSGWFWIP